MVHLLSHRAGREHQHDHEGQRCYVHKSSHKVILRFVPRELRCAMLIRHMYASVAPTVQFASKGT